MQKTQFHQSYRAARIGASLPDNLESVAAIIALQDRQKVDQIGAGFRFAYDLSGQYERLEKREETKARREARRNAVEYKFDYSILDQG